MTSPEQANPKRACTHPECGRALQSNNNDPDGRCYRHRIDHRDGVARYAEQAEYQARYREDNRDAINAANRLSRLKLGPEDVSRRKALAKAGMTPEQFADMFEAQDGRCAICRRALAGWGRGTHIDHDHVTLVIRGILCHGCNPGLGNFGDDPARLRAAADYLERHRRE